MTQSLRDLVMLFFVTSMFYFRTKWCGYTIMELLTISSMLKIRIKYIFKSKTILWAALQDTPTMFKRNENQENFTYFYDSIFWIKEIVFQKKRKPSSMVQNTVSYDHMKCSSQMLPTVQFLKDEIAYNHSIQLQKVETNKFTLLL